MEKKLQKPYLTNENLLMAQDLWQAQCQTLLIILLKEFTKLNVNMNMIRKNMKHVDKDCECCVEYSNVKHDLIEYKCLCRNKNYQNKFDRNLREYHELYVQKGTIFRTFRICLETYGLDPAHFPSATGLAWHSFLKKSKIRSNN